MRSVSSAFNFEASGFDLSRSSSFLEDGLAKE